MMSFALTVIRVTVTEVQPPHLPDALPSRATWGVAAVAGTIPGTRKAERTKRKTRLVARTLFQLRTLDVRTICYLKFKRHADSKLVPRFGSVEVEASRTIVVFF